ncbi:hypothetical protein P8631_11015 [Guyparkeria sp. 1SP6A2]|nr:hypothetical protein [Guyparkeria sp. 1SP6A2]
MQSIHDQDHQIERELKKAKLLREGSYIILGFALYAALMLLNQDGVISIPAWLVSETAALEIKPIMYLAGFAALQAKAKEIELDAGHDHHGF